MICNKNAYKITIDGPAGSGKSSLAKLIAKELDLIHLDTGALYRSIALYFCQNFKTVETLTNEDLERSLPNINVDYKQSSIILNGEDVTTKIRSNEVSQTASKLASIEMIRDFCNKLQKQIIAKNDNIVMDGRDSGTVIMPQAQFKFFLKTNPRVRAIRRLKDQNKELSAENIDVLTNEINERDLRDTNRKIAPLVPASDAHLIDNSHETLEETFKTILKIIKK